MNHLGGLSDKEFVPFLNDLGVDTDNMLFVWMLSDPDYAGVLEWLYNNLDRRNVLTAREAWRFVCIHLNLIISEPASRSAAFWQETLS